MHGVALAWSACRTSPLHPRALDGLVTAAVTAAALKRTLVQLRPPAGQHPAARRDGGRGAVAGDARAGVRRNEEPGNGRPAGAVRHAQGRAAAAQARAAGGASCRGGSDLGRRGEAWPAGLAWGAAGAATGGRGADRPTPQVVRTAHMLGIDLIFDSDLLYVAEEMLMQPLPGEEVGGGRPEGGREGPVRLGAAAGGGRVDGAADACGKAPGRFAEGS